MDNALLDLALLHGGGQGSWVWNETLAAVRNRADSPFGRILALDIPGCGTKRDRATEHLQPRDVARELINDLLQAGMQRIVLVGHSLAGNVLPALLEMRPDLFHRLIYVSCSLPLPSQTVLQLMGHRLQGASKSEVGWPVDPSTTQLRDRYEAMYCNDMSETQKTGFLADLMYDDWPRSYFTATDFSFQNLDRVPATYVVCQTDRALPVEWQETFAERLHAKRVLRIDAGHQVMITRPQALADLLHDEAKVAG